MKKLSLEKQTQLKGGFLQFLLMCVIPLAVGISETIAEEVYKFKALDAQSHLQDNSNKKQIELSKKYNNATSLLFA